MSAGSEFTIECSKSFVFVLSVVYMLLRAYASSKEDSTVRKPFWREKERAEDMGERCTTPNDHCWY